MRCKKCRQIMSDEEREEILEQLVDGYKPVRMCDTCIDEEMESEDERRYDGTSDLDD